DIAYQGGQAGLEQIWTQKWIALFGQGPEAYAEWRRTATPVLPIGPDAENNRQIPLRLLYPAAEEAYNRDAVEAARARQGGDALSHPVWWDVTGGGRTAPQGGTRACTAAPTEGTAPSKGGAVAYISGRTTSRRAAPAPVRETVAPVSSVAPSFDRQYRPRGAARAGRS